MESFPFTLKNFHTLEERLRGALHLWKSEEPLALLRLRHLCFGFFESTRILRVNVIYASTSSITLTRCPSLNIHIWMEGLYCRNGPSGYWTSFWCHSYWFNANLLHVLAFCKALLWLLRSSLGRCCPQPQSQTDTQRGKKLLNGKNTNVNEIRRYLHTTIKTC